MSSDLMPKTAQAAMITEWKTASTSGAKIVLFTGNLVPGGTTTYAEVDAAKPAPDWYDAVGKAATYGSSNENSDGSLSVAVQSQEWVYSGTGSAVTITGYAVVIPSTTTLIQCKLLPVAKEMANILDVLIVTPVITFPAIAAS